MDSASSSSWIKPAPSIRILIVGAGFAGSVIARELADHGGYNVTVIDRRDHIAGNCYDPRDQATGVRVHHYGPHIFHTSDQHIVDYLSRFTEWIPYQHEVQARVDGVGDVPLPINIDTINAVYGQSLESPEEMKAFLAEMAIPKDHEKSARDVAEGTFGKHLTELFFARYTKKMWDLDLDQLPASVLRRLPIRYDQSTGYFNDTFQAMPKDGYHNLFTNMLDHPHISVQLQTAFDKKYEEAYHHIFNSMPIDVYFDECYGPLPYRSIQFETSEDPGVINQQVPTVNFTDEGPHTRITRWDLYPGCAPEDGSSSTLSTKERPCDYVDNNFERYYPVKTVDGAPQQRYQQYADLAKDLKHMTFIGRCGQYRYFDMHQVVANSRNIAQNFLNLRTAL